MRELQLKGFFVCLGLVILIANLGSAASCDVRLRTACTTSPWNNILMGLSATTNAHAQDSEQTSYPYVLCCDFSGDTNDCGANNESVILRLSSSTNAHAEINDPAVINPPNYNVRVCYSDLECIYTLDSVCPIGHGIEMVSLSSYTNAHVGEFDFYSGKICCVDTGTPSQQNCDAQGGEICHINLGQACPGTILESADDNPPTTICCDEACTGGTTGMCTLVSVTWEKATALEGELVDINVTGSADCVGTTISFEVREDDILFDDSVETNPRNAMFYSDGSTAKAISNWTAEWQDDGGDDPIYYVKAFVDPGNFLSSEDGGLYKYLEVAQTEFSCSQVVTCNDYPEALCEANSCEDLSNVIENSALLYNNGSQLCGYSECSASNIWYDGCGCNWNDATDKCEFISTARSCDASSMNFTIGTCHNGPNSVKDCDTDPVGLYIVSWEGIWDWGQNNFATPVTCSSNCTIGTCIEEISSLGNWHCDVESSQLFCEQDGTRTIQCPDELPLPFFNFYNFLASVLAIAIIYGILQFNKRDE